MDNDKLAQQLAALGEQLAALAATIQESADSDDFVSDDDQDDQVDETPSYGPVPSQLSGRVGQQVAGRIRRRNGVLHVQLETVPGSNRQYGCSLDIAGQDHLEEVVSTRPHSLPSLAGTGNRYVATAIGIGAKGLVVNVAGAPFTVDYSNVTVL